MTSEKEKRLLLLLSIVYLGGSGTKKKVLDTIENKSWIKLSLDSKEIMHTRNEPKWRNNLAFIRQHLVNDYCISDLIRDDWRITKNGEKHFDELCLEALSTVSFKHLSNQAFLTIESIINNDKILNQVNEDLESLKHEEEYFEGPKSKRYSTYHERNPKLRSKAILLNGLECMICGFDFFKAYGERGRNYIEVHHKKPISELKETTKIDPKEDMIVVCANCHRIIHRKKDNILDLEQIRNIINVRYNYMGVGEHNEVSRV